MPTVCFQCSDALFSVNGVCFGKPVYSVDGHDLSDFRFAGQSADRPLRNGGIEHTAKYLSASLPDIGLTLSLRTFPDNAIVRFRYTLTGDGTHALTKPEGIDRLTYFTLPAPDGDSTEIRLSEFDSIAHTFAPTYVPVDDCERAAGAAVCGPILLFEGETASLLAYEHGAECPDRYLEFGLNRDTVMLRAVKGNYWHRKPLTAQPSVWFEYGTAATREALFRDYRDFFLRYISEFSASRKPYIFYNTWNGQERHKHFEGGMYLDIMNLDYTLKEIEVAHRMGVEVYVLDTGWYNKTGDWIVNDKRFPEHLRQVKAKLDEYGMQLGLWFNPIVAARSTAIYREHPEYVVSRDGREEYWGSIWETEESYGMCLCTDYADYFADQLIRLAGELGVRYFKWDAIFQYGCNSTQHDHGCNTPEESGECFAYGQGLRMLHVVERLSEACPDAIVDFDITEAARFVGLGFLAVGKYFLINNGPYFHDFGVPPEALSDPAQTNVFFYPGSVARSRVCRKSILFDELIPSVLFLTHFLPDAPRLSQDNAIASMLLGGNGIWGPLQQLSDQDVQAFADALIAYKRVREDVTAAYPRIKGKIGGSPEVYEKLNVNGRGMVIFFTHNGGTLRHVTVPLPDAAALRVTGADRVERTENGSLILTVKLERDGARCVFVE